MKQGRICAYLFDNLAELDEITLKNQEENK
jgi:hypothetical protein